MEHLRFKLKALAAAALLAAAPLAADDMEDALKSSIERLRAGTAPTEPREAEAAPKPRAKPAQPKPVAAATRVPSPSPSPSPSPAPTVQAAPDWQARVEALEKQAKAPLLKWEGFGQIRLDSQSRLRGLYGRRLEAKATLKPLPKLKLVLGYDFLENKAKDFGLEISDLWSLKVQLGQFRQKFGVEPQQGSAKTLFIERALMYGGSHPFPAGASVQVLVKERVLGLHLVERQEFGPLAVELAGSIANNAKDDQARGENKLALAFPTQAADENPSLIGRLGLESGLNGLKAKLGASLTRDSQNASFEAQRLADLQVEELIGLDLSLDWHGWLALQTEWAASNLSKGLGAAPGDFWGGVTRRREAWYAALSLQPLKAFMQDPPKLELMARHDSYLPHLHSTAAGPRSYQASALGLRLAWWNACTSSLNYTAYAADGSYSALAGTESLFLQQQFIF